MGCLAMPGMISLGAMVSTHKTSAEHPPNLLEICAFQTGLPKDPSQPEPWQCCLAQDYLPAFLPIQALDWVVLQSG